MQRNTKTKKYKDIKRQRQNASLQAYFEETMTKCRRADLCYKNTKTKIQSQRQNASLLQANHNKHCIRHQKVKYKYNDKVPVLEPTTPMKRNSKTRCQRNTSRCWIVPNWLKTTHPSISSIGIVSLVASSPGFTWLVYFQICDKTAFMSLKLVFCWRKIEPLAKNKFFCHP